MPVYANLWRGHSDRITTGTVGTVAWQRCNTTYCKRLLQANTTGLYHTCPLGHFAVQVLDVRIGHTRFGLHTDTMPRDTPTHHVPPRNAADAWHRCAGT